MIPKTILENISLNLGIDNMYLAMPEIFIFCSTLILMLLDIFFFKEKSFKNTNKFGISIILLSFILTLFLPTNGVGFNNLYIVNELSIFFKLLILSSILFVFLLTYNKAEFEGIKFSELNFLLLLSTCGMLVLVSSNNFLTFFLALELQALPIYVICALRRNNIKSAEASLKYFLLGALSSGFILFGISLIYGFVGSISFEYLSNITFNNNIGINCGIIFILAGIAFKISSAPFHMWAPDVYEGTPSPITFFIATAPKISIIGILIYLVFKVFQNINENLSDLLIVLSISSMLIGSIGAIVQKNLKRLIAYSSIANMGFILVGMVTFSEKGLQAIIYYLIIYLFLLIGVFGIILSLQKDDKPIELISDLKGLYNNHPFISICLLIFMFSLAGIPPLSGFFGKWLIFFAAIDNQFYVLAILGVLFSVISAFYYLKIIRFMFFENTDVPLVVVNTKETRFLIYISLFISVLFFILFPVMDYFILNIKI